MYSTSDIPINNQIAKEYSAEEYFKHLKFSIPVQLSGVCTRANIFRYFHSFEKAGLFEIQAKGECLICTFNKLQKENSDTTELVTYLAKELRIYFKKKAVCSKFCYYHSPSYTSNNLDNNQQHQCNWYPTFQEEHRPGNTKIDTHARHEKKSYAQAVTTKNTDEQKQHNNGKGEHQINVPIKMKINQFARRHEYMLYVDGNETRQEQIPERIYRTKSFYPSKLQIATMDTFACAANMCDPPKTQSPANAEHVLNKAEDVILETVSPTNTEDILNKAEDATLEAMSPTNTKDVSDGSENTTLEAVSPTNTEDVSDGSEDTTLEAMWHKNTGDVSDGSEDTILEGMSPINTEDDLNGTEDATLVAMSPTNTEDILNGNEDATLETLLSDDKFWSDNGYATNFVQNKLVCKQQAASVAKSSRFLGMIFRNYHTTYLRNYLLFTCQAERDVYSDAKIVGVKSIWNKYINKIVLKEVFFVLKHQPVVCELPASRYWQEDDNYIFPLTVNQAISYALRMDWKLFLEGNKFVPEIRVL